VKSRQIKAKAGAFFSPMQSAPAIATSIQNDTATMLAAEDFPYSINDGE